MINFLLSILSTHVTSFISSLGYWGLAVCMALESCNFPIPSEIIQPFGGYLVSIGRINIWGAVLAGTAGGTIGSFISYYLGKYAIEIPYLSGHSCRNQQCLKDWFARYGERTVFFGRLIPIVRTFISLPAGAARMNIPRFLLYTFMGSLIWSILLTYIGYMLGENWEIMKTYFHQVDMILGAGLVVITMFYFVYRNRVAQKYIKK